MNFASNLHYWADIASIFTFVITLTGAVVGIGGYLRFLHHRHDQSKRLEAFLHTEMLKGDDNGFRSVMRIIKDVGLTQDEAIQASFRNPRIGRRVTADERGLANQLLFEYIPKK
jgi:hypothetical protein